MFKLQKQNYKQDKSGERVDFRFSNFQLLQVLPSRSFLFFDLCYFLLFLVLLLSHYYFVGVIILYFLISKTTLKNVFLELKSIRNNLSVVVVVSDTNLHFLYTL